MYNSHTAMLYANYIRIKAHWLSMNIDDNTFANIRFNKSRFTYYNDHYC